MSELPGRLMSTDGSSREHAAATGDALVVMYCTEWCPYCRRADRLLESKGVTSVHRIRVDLEPDRRREMKERSGRTTVPQVFIRGHHVGGYDDLAALDRAGKLDALLADDSGQ